MKSWMAPIAATVVTVVAAIPMYLSAQLSFLDIWLSLWTIIFVVGFALIALEGAFFMQPPEIRRVSQFVVAFVATGVMAAIVAALTSSDGLEFSLADKCRVLLAERSEKDWIVRFAGVAGLYMLVYVVIGSATWPFVREYYSDPKKKRLDATGARRPDHHCAADVPWAAHDDDALPTDRNHSGI